MNKDVVAADHSIHDEAVLDERMDDFSAANDRQSVPTIRLRR